MSPLQQRLLALGLGLGAAGLLGGFLLRDRGTRELDLMEADEEAIAQVGESLPITEARAGLVRRDLDEETVRKLMPLRGRTRTFDPHCYFRYTANVRTKMNFRDHPDKFYWRVTNDLGLRMDANLREDATPFVLVAGDSHIDGVCNNAEGLAGQLEGHLAMELPGVQVANSGCGAYTFYHYLGVLERMVSLGQAPDVFLMVVFGGNDFGALPTLSRMFENQPRQPWPREASLLRKEVRPAPLGQGALAVEHFHLFPEDEELALRVALQATLEIEALCQEIGCQLLVAYLPAPLELPDQAPLRESHEVLEHFGLTPEDAGVLGRMADRYLIDLEREGVRALDLRPTFREADEILYWKLDLHLAVAGHRRAAEALSPFVLQASRPSRQGTHPR